MDQYVLNFSLGSQKRIPLPKNSRELGAKARQMAGGLLAVVSGKTSTGKTSLESGRFEHGIYSN